MTETTFAPGTRSDGQTFLVGPSLYLRAADLADAQTAAIWRTPPFPMPAEVVETELRERFERGIHEEERLQLLIACRRSDDRPVGSVNMRFPGWRYAGLEFSIESILSESDQDQLLAELLRLPVPWLISERNMMAVESTFVDGLPLVESTIAEFGGRVATRLREFRLINGRRRDEIWYQIFNPVWVAKLGLPPEPVHGPVQRSVTSRAKRSVLLPAGERPPDAFAAGERIYLRPFRPEEGALAEKWSMQETEVYFPEGRWIVNSFAYGHSHKKWARPDPPEKIRFAIALRESGELIGATGIQDINWIHRTAETETELFRKQHRNAGLGTEAKHLMLEYAFERLGFHAVYSFVSETNPRSAAGLRKQGYRDAGYIAWEAFGSDGLGGAWMFDLLADEWRAARVAAVGMKED